MKHLLISIILLFTGFFAVAQQDPQFSMNMYTHMAINPAYAGAKEALCATGLIRQQWMGFEDPSGDKTAPKTMYFSFDAFTRRLSSGFGIVFLQDKIAFESNTFVKLSYAYRLPLGPGRLGIGAQVSFLDKQIDFEKYVPKDKNDPLLISKAKQSDMLMDYAVGLFYSLPQFYAGISATQVSQAEFAAVAGGASPSLKRHYYIIGGYNYDINTSLQLQPSVLIKTDFASTQYDINARVLYNNMIWGGLSYRPQDALVAMAGVEMSGFETGISYDITTSALGSGGRSSGTVEVFLRYCFKIVIPHYPQGHRTVRFL